jgi:cytochrome c oxidase cbb3-type subunit III
MLTLFKKFYSNRKAGKIGLLSLLLVTLVQPVWAAGPPEPSIFSNALALTMLIVMLILLIIIAVLAGLLVSTADMKAKKEKKASSITAASLFLIFLLSSPAIIAQDATQADAATQTAKSASQVIGGLSASTFYIMVTVIFLELFIILALLINVKFLLKTEKEKLIAALSPEEAKMPKITWWSRFNKFKPVEQEADIDLGHDYDGIRELDNRLPPWWLYGFYVTIVFAAVYLWRFHVSHTAPSSKEEYDQSVVRAELKLQEYLKLKGDAVNENTVTVLSGADDIAAGKKIFTTSCASCHKEAGGGDVGPNLTDEFWIHGGDIKSIFKVVKYGINAMPQWQNAYSNKQIAQVSSFIKLLKGTNPPNPKAPQGELYKEEESVKPVVDSAVAKDNKVVTN